MGANYGQILGLLLGMGGLTALGSHLKANKLNDYDENLNTNLTTQGAAPLAFKHRKFAFGDTNDQMTAHKSLYEQALKAHQQQQELTDDNTLGGQYGLPTFHSPEAAKAAIAPYQTQDAGHRVGGQYGPKALKGALALQNIFGPGQNGQQLPNQLPPMFAPNSDPQNPTLQAGATQTELPPELDGQYYTPDMVKEAQGRAVTERGQDLTAQTASTGQKLIDARERAKMIQQSQHNRATEQYQARMAKVAESRAAVYARTAGLHSFSKSDQVFAAYKHGKISEDQYKAWLASDGAAQGDTITTTKDPSGNVTKITETHRSRNTGGGASAPGHSVDLGGGIQIKGF